MKIIYIFLIIVLIIAITFLIIGLRKDYARLHEADKKNDETNVNMDPKKILQEEKKKTEIEYLHNKAYFYKNLSDLIGLFNSLLVISIIITLLFFIVNFSFIVNLLR